MDLGLLKLYMDYFQDLNLGAFGTFSPLNILSAPTLRPSLGHPYLGPKTLWTSPQEL
jgi:hypothetical protein